mgnify:CR=1 FL=1
MLQLAVTAVSHWVHDLDCTALEEAEERNEQAKSLLGDAARRLEDTERLMHVSQQEALASLREELETMTVRAERMV